MMYNYYDFTYYNTLQKSNYTFTNQAVIPEPEGYYVVEVSIIIISKQCV